MKKLLTEIKDFVSWWISLFTEAARAEYLTIMGKIFMCVLYFFGTIFVAPLFLFIVGLRLICECIAWAFTHLVFKKGWR